LRFQLQPDVRAASKCRNGASLPDEPFAGILRNEQMSVHWRSRASFDVTGVMSFPRLDANDATARREAGTTDRSSALT
jgi:hypothetical protein